MPVYVTPIIAEILGTLMPIKIAAMVIKIIPKKKLRKSFTVSSLLSLTLKIQKIAHITVLAKAKNTPIGLENLKLRGLP